MNPMQSPNTGVGGKDHGHKMSIRAMMEFAPTFYLDFSSGQWQVSCINSDNCQTIIIGKSYDKLEAIKSARRYYFGSIRKGEKYKLVNVSDR